MGADAMMSEGQLRDAPAFMEHIGAFLDNVEHIDAAHGRAEKRQALARFRKENQKSLIGLNRQNRAVHRTLATLAQRTLSPDELASIFNLALEQKKYEQEQMFPKLDRLKTILKDRTETWEKDALSCLEESVSLTERWLKAHCDLTNGIFEIVNKQRAQTTKVLRARSSESEVDHGALIDEIIARFPNILKALAE
jgi:hypothetical protein